MSKYEQYNTTSINYDKTRTAVGIEVILGYLTKLNRPAHLITVLDAGCGTGNYALELARVGINVVCADYSENMLAQCRKKIESNGLSNTVWKQCDLSLYSSEGQVYDAVMCNQSLHHLDPADDFKSMKHFLSEAAKSLKDDGVILINTITHNQLEDGVWWGKLIETAVHRMKPRFIEYEPLQAFLRTIGFQITDRVINIDSIIQKTGYFDPHSLASLEFRQGDSHFALLDEKELGDVLKCVEQMVEKGTIQNYIVARDRLRQQIGQFTYYVIKKIEE
ncbi:methyltransferase domain-containing protein [Pseudomonas sp. HR96]|uniref:class I SAM-dependent methyltransferase n=1 Tax=Pseudomonas sp. HR96 TaxID=1027966 RepID=UPI002A75B6F5|nr:methyltransferase domain-containing protein [Pseudomonas sp. HR96]WPP00919.1 methyltransferase domain-containing protein [Pseudomonas sp. HR96]